MRAPITKTKDFDTGGSLAEMAALITGAESPGGKKAPPLRDEALVNLRDLPHTAAVPEGVVRRMAAELIDARDKLVGYGAPPQIGNPPEPLPSTDVTDLMVAISDTWDVHFRDACMGHEDAIRCSLRHYQHASPDGGLAWSNAASAIKHVMLIRWSEAAALWFGEKS